MFLGVVWAFLALSCMGVAAQDLAYHFAMGVTSPAPVPGKPFTFTWTGGQPTEAVYIVLNAYFEEDPNQNIIYITTDILSNAPNNGSWTYIVPLDITAGRHSFSIGYNPLQLSDQTEIFIILSSQTSPVSVAPSSSTSNTAFQSYNGCGLPPLPDYTYTDYQPPCTVTTDGLVETLYPIVPPSLSLSFFGSIHSTTLEPSATPTGSTNMSSSPSPMNTAFASGIFAQALQCPTTVMPSRTTITASGATTVFSLVGCTRASGLSTTNFGTCHTSGYTTFSVSGTSSVCCPDGWPTTPLNSELFCFTSIEQDAKRATGEKRQASTETPVVISGLVFTTAGVVTSEAEAVTSSSSSPTTTGSTASASAKKGGGVKLDSEIWGMMILITVLYYFV